MKTISVLSTLVFILFLGFSFAQSTSAIKQDTLKVWGNCGMCKKKIETAAVSAGASTANWDEATKIMTVSYASEATSNEKIQQAIAIAGYDTEKFTADQQAYDKLHSCCHYDRKDSKVADATCACCKDGKCSEMKADCKKDGKCCKDSASCSKDSKCCKDDASVKKADCCKEGVACSKDHTGCKDGKCSKEGTACKKGGSCCKKPGAALKS